MMRRLRWAGLLVVAAACRTPTEPDSRAAVIRLKLGGGFGLQVAPGDFLSVLDRASLRIGSDGPFSATFGEGVADADIPVTLKSGSKRFQLDVLSKNQTLLFQADQTLTVPDSPFTITITPTAVNAVLVVQPKNPAYTLIDTGQSRLFIAGLTVRNAGSSTLLWRVDSLRPTGITGVTCNVPATEANCLTTQTTPARTNVLITVTFVTAPSVGTAPAAGIHVISQVGDLFPAKQP